MSAAADSGACSATPSASPAPAASLNVPVAAVAAVDAAAGAATAASRAASLNVPMAAEASRMGAVSGALVSWLLTDAATAAAQHLDANRDAIEKDAGVVSIAHIHGLGKSPEEAAARLAGLWWGTVTPTTTREAAFAAHFEPVRAAQACIVADISNASGPFAPPPSIDDASASTMLPVADVAKVTGLDEDALIAGACRVVDGLRTAADDGRVLKTAYEGLDLAAGAIAARLGLLALGPAPAVSDMERRYAAHLQPARDLRRAVAAALRSQLARSEAAAGGGTAAPSGAAAAGAASAGASSARYGVTPASLHSTSAPLPATRAATGGAAAAPSTPATNSSRSADAAIVRPGSLGAASGEFMTVNIVLLGDSAAGKTSIIRRLVRNEYDLTLVATIGTEFRPWLVTIRGAPVKCLVRDSAGAERFRIYSLSYLRGALAVVLVYDVQCAASFRGIPNWIHSVQEHEGLHPNALCALIGAKADTDYRQVSTAEGQALADKHGFKFFEVSAATGAGVTEAFTAIAQETLMRLDPKLFTASAPAAGAAAAGAATAASGAPVATADCVVS